MKISVLKNVSCLCFLLFPCFAYAHTMVSTMVNWVSGFSHPFQGVDHLLAMVALGWWAAQLRGVYLFLLPLTFLLVMAFGGLLGHFALISVDAEKVILMSGIILTILALKKVHFHLFFNLAVVAFFAFFHGYAHGVAISDSAHFLSYSFGLISATVVLHITGIMSALAIDGLLISVRISQV